MVVSGVLFVVRKKSDGARRRKHSIADADARMIGEPGADLEFADGETEIFEFLDLDVCRNLAQADGEKGAFHLAGQHVLQAVPRSFVAENTQMVLRLVNRQKKRQTLDMVPVRVRQQQRQVQRLVVELSRQFSSQQPQTGAGI